MSDPARHHLISREEIRAVYTQGEEAVITLVAGLLERIEKLEARIEVLEGKASKTSQNSNKRNTSKTAGSRCSIADSSGCSSSL